MSTDRRVRGRKLQRIRKWFLQEHPLCVRCEAAGRVSAATQVDHIVPLFKGGEDSDQNRQGLCDDCHKAKTREDLGQRERIGCDADGIPTSVAHHWR